MSGAVKQDIRFPSADGKSSVAGTFTTCPDVKPFCILQISHGMCEYMARYDHFAAAMAAHGVVVCGNDHLGHGDTSDPEDYGHFTHLNGRRYALLDLKTMNQKARAAWPGLPLVLLGHSMGSFFARQYAAQWPDTLDGLIISGTGGPNPLAGFGIALTRVLSAFRGDRYRSKFVRNIAFGAYLKRIPNPTSIYAWVSSDDAVVQRYEEEPRCNFTFTLNGFHELFSALREVSNPAWAARLPKDLPIFLFSGEADPVGDYGRGVATVHGWLQEAGIETLEYKLYPGGRHEMLNEVNRQEAYADVLGFLERHFK